MTVGEIIKAVRFCYDEEAIDSADFRNASAQDNTYMDNIIKSKIGDAVRWICLYSPAELLGGSDEKDGSSEPIDTGIIVDAEVSSGSPIDSITIRSIFIIEFSTTSVSTCILISRPRNSFDVKKN